MAFKRLIIRCVGPLSWLLGMKAKAALTKIDYLWRFWISILILDIVFMAWGFFDGFDRYVLFGSLDFSDFLIAYWWLISVGVIALLSFFSYPLILLDSRQPLTLRLVWAAAAFFFFLPGTIMYWLTMIEVPRFHTLKDSSVDLIHYN